MTQPDQSLRQAIQIRRDAKLQDQRNRDRRLQQAATHKANGVEQLEHIVRELRELKIMFPVRAGCASPIDAVFTVDGVLVIQCWPDTMITVHTVGDFDGYSWVGSVGTGSSRIPKWDLTTRSFADLRNWFASLVSEFEVTDPRDTQLPDLPAPRPAGRTRVVDITPPVEP